jgi:hypothetical protein
MRTIWKFELFEMTAAVVPHRVISIPADARLVAVAMQGPRIFGWFVVDPSAPSEPRAYRVLGTGHDVPEDGTHVGSVFDGPFVWHVFEVPVDQAVN